MKIVPMIEFPIPGPLWDEKVYLKKPGSICKKIEKKISCHQVALESENDNLSPQNRKFFQKKHFHQFAFVYLYLY